MGEQHVQYKTCSRCNREKPLDGFHRQATRGDGRAGWASRCKACVSEIGAARRAADPQKHRDRARAYRQANPDKVRERNRRYRNDQPDYAHKRRLALYGLTVEDYAQLVEAQDGRCAICRDLPSDARRLHVDHDHATGEIRALLCTRCNVGLGAFRDRIDLLTAAIDYLRGEDRG